MKYEEILVLFVLNPEEFITYIGSFESQIKELTENLILLESRLNQ